MWTGAEARRGAGENSSRDRGRSPAAVLSHQIVMRHGGHLFMSSSGVVGYKSQLERTQRQKKESKLSRGPGRTAAGPERSPQAFWCPDLVSTRDLGPAGVDAVLRLAGIMKSRPADFRQSLTGRQMVMFFEKASLRTRLTFEAGMVSLGGSAMFVDQIVLRTISQQTIEGIAQHACVPVVNALSDLEHPCQALADYFTLMERFGNAKNCCLAYVGDGNNVAHS